MVHACRSTPRIRTVPVPSRSSILASVAWLVALVPGSAEGAQVVRGAPDTISVVVDTGDVQSVARRAQARFERRRARLLPTTHQGLGGSCDEVVGRICVTFGEGEWYPRPEDQEIVQRRRDLIAELDSLQSLVPGDSWMLGQRVWYRAEDGAWGEALATAERCGLTEVERWWCRALEGFALHGLGRYERAAEAFGDALSTMGEERARRWSVPRWAVDDDIGDLLEQAEPYRGSADDAIPGTEAVARDEATDSLPRLLTRLWALSDPLYLVDGNDRRTAHLARWTVSEIREGARNPFRLPWGDDLTELTVRHGWQEGWERVPGRSPSSDDYVIGHDHPMGRDYMPAGEVLASPAEADAEALQPRVRRPRSLYAPRYAPVLLPMDGQLAVFPRGGTMTVVATHFLPEDTTFHADHRHPRPWLDPGDQARLPDRIGLFAWPVGERGASADRTAGLLGPGERSDDPGDPPVYDDPVRTVHGVRARGQAAGALALELPATDHVVSAESWSPALRRAGRHRRGVRARRVVPDVATLSDILLMDPMGTEPQSVEETLDALLPVTRVSPGQPLAIAWEVSGLGFRAESLRFQVSVVPVDRDVFHRIGDFLGLSHPPRPLGLSWEEPAPGEPFPLFRYLELDLPPLEAGRYEIRLLLRTAGRSDVSSVLPFEVAPGA